MCNLKLAESKKELIYVNAFTDAPGFYSIENDFPKDFDNLPVFVTGTYQDGPDCKDVLTMGRNSYYKRANVQMNEQPMEQSQYNNLAYEVRMREKPRPNSVPTEALSIASM